MKIENWLKLNTISLIGKTVAITGSTGGIGKPLCAYIASLGANLILLDRNQEKSTLHKQELLNKFANISVKCILFDAEDVFSVKQACQILINEQIDFLILNAGAYKIPRKKSVLNLENVYQINFVSPYYLTKQLLPILQKNSGRVIAVSSIAHNYSKADFSDIDFSKKTSCEKIYGNSKRYLTFSLFELFKNETKASLAIAHPGISFTNITAHYPKLIFALIKHPMKIIFPAPKKACLSLLLGLFCKTETNFWIGPKLFNIWGLPKNKRLNTAKHEEAQKIFTIAEKIYLDMDKKTP